MKRIAINGFGRIGRMILKASLNNPFVESMEEEELEFVAINDLTDTKTLAHLFKYDSVHGTFDRDVEHTNNSLIIDGKEIKVFAEKEPEKLPWKELGIDIVVESTGRFLTKESAEKHINAGAKKVLLSAPPKSDDIKTFVKGVNEDEYNREEDDIISNASCTTNCFAPMAKVLNDNFGIRRGFMVTIHSYTAGQRIVDAPHKDLRRARAAAINIVPTTTGSAKAVGKVIPSLQGKLHASAIRVPTPNVSLTYFTVELERKTTPEEVNALFESVSKHHLKGVLEYSEEPLVSTDITGNPHSCIIDSLLTEEDGELVKVVGWYDNEWGYSCRMIDLLKMM